TVFFFFLFQAEDGIRDYKVTGVQTCALPISAQPGKSQGRPQSRSGSQPIRYARPAHPAFSLKPLSRWLQGERRMGRPRIADGLRSEERRVGKEGRSGGWA